MWLIDFPTLLLILVGGIELGAQGFFGASPLGLACGPHWRVILYDAIGAAAVWQFFRQKFR